MVAELSHRILSKLRGRRGAGPELDRQTAAQRDSVAADFDAAYYAERYPDVITDGLTHFMALGWREMRDPAPWFSTAFYLATYPDIADAGFNPFYHFVAHGRAEGRLGRPEDGVEPWEVATIRQGLDTAFYAEQLRQHALDARGLDLATHYWREGAAMGLDPAPDFSTLHYLADHDDVGAAGLNPFVHYLGEGRREQRGVRSALVAQLEAVSVGEMQPAVSLPSVSLAQSEAPDLSPPIRDRDLIASAFDAAYYRSAYHDIDTAGVDPLDHYIEAGWAEGRSPNAWFSPSDYLEFHPDIVRAGVNPFLHYLRAGKAEGRTPRHDLGFRFDILKSLQPLDQRIVYVRAFAPKRKLSKSVRLRDALSRAKGLAAKGLYISVSHDDFTENVGGVQLVLTREASAIEAMGYDHFHLFPAVPLPVVELEVDDPLIGVLLNRKRLGFFRASEVENELALVADRVCSAPFAIHSLIGHRAEALVAILTAAGCKTGHYWVHDYSSACAGFTLLRNDVQFCGGPPPGSAACSICVYGELRTEQMAAHRLLFDALDLTVVAPSEAALDTWKAAVPLNAPARVHEHLPLTIAKPKSRRSTRDSKASCEPLRVAYIGQPVAHKGWHAFRELTLSFGNDPRYRFFHVGKEQQPGVPASFREVAVGRDNLDAMVDALRDLKIDVAILWSLWPETFCIAAVEALRAGACLVTYKDSGNVAAIVRKTGFGTVLDSERALADLFDSGEIVDLASRARPVGLTAEFSNMTADLIEDPAPDVQAVRLTGAGSRA